MISSSNGYNQLEPRMGNHMKLIGQILSLIVKSFLCLLLLGILLQVGTPLISKLTECKQDERSLINAARMGDMRQIELLLKAGVNPDCRCGYTDTPIEAAAKPEWDLKNNAKLEKNSITLIDTLIEAGAKPEKSILYHIDSGMTATEEIIIHLIKRGTYTQEQLDKLLITYSSRPSVMQALMNKGGNINAGYIEKGRGPDTISAGSVEDTPLVHAAREGNLKAVQFLLAKGADPNAPGSMRETALIAVSGLGVSRWSDNYKAAPDIIKSLIQARADTKPENICGHSSLIVAAAKGQAESVRLLLNAGASPNSRDHRTRDKTICFSLGRTGLVSQRHLDSDRAEHRRNYLKIQDGDYKAGVFRSQSRDIAQRFYDDNVDGPFEGTALMWAAYSGDFEAVKLLLAKGADVNARDSYGTTAYMWGHLSGNPKVLDSLLKAGADTSAVDAFREDASAY